MSKGTTTTRRDPSQNGEPRAASFDRLSATSLTKVFHSRRQGTVVAFQDVNLTVRDREFVSILGPSGCGKTTLLHVISGLDTETSGEVSIDGRVVRNSERTPSFGYMFQRDLLMPWSRIVDNVALGSVIQGTRPEEARRQARELMDRYGLGPFAHSYPSQLSGGMRQRAALIRTLLVDRPIMLLDEPFGALDALTRSIMQEWLLRLWEES
jgi:ABC-type nitrate/sulfonate/bicarbonate transport system ATPase subunit